MRDLAFDRESASTVPSVRWASLRPHPRETLQFPSDSMGFAVDQAKCARSADDARMANLCRSNLKYY